VRVPLEIALFYSLSLSEISERSGSLSLFKGDLEIFLLPFPEYGNLDLGTRLGFPDHVDKTFQIFYFFALEIRDDVAG